MPDNTKTATVMVDGIEVEYDPNILASPKFSMAIGDIADDDLDDGEKLLVNARLMRMLFGQRRYALMDELEARDLELRDWLPSFFGAVGAKN